ncbi:MAG: hypothetical protein WD397_01440 [Wenzhouxiangellaceae bacterium]
MSRTLIATRAASITVGRLLPRLADGNSVFSADTNSTRITGAIRYAVKGFRRRLGSGTLVGCGLLLIQSQKQKPFRRQLRWLMRVTFFDCKKSNQKCALQAAEAGGAG